MIGLFVLGVIFIFTQHVSGPTMVALSLLSFLGLLAANANMSSWYLHPSRLPPSVDGVIVQERIWFDIILSELEAWCPASFYLLTCAMQADARYGPDLGGVVLVISAIACFC